MSLPCRCRILLYEVSEETYRSVRSSAKASPSVEPVIVAELIDFDAPLVLGLLRHVLRHHRRVFALLQRDVGLVLGRQTGARRVGGKGERASPGPLGRYDRCDGASWQ